MVCRFFTPSRVSGSLLTKAFCEREAGWRGLPEHVTGLRQENASNKKGAHLNVYFHPKPIECSESPRHPTSR